MLKTNVDISDSYSICPTYWCVCSHQFTKVGNGERMFHWVCGFRVEGSLFKANLQDDQWDRCLGSATFGYAMPTKLPWEFPLFHDSKITATSKCQTAAVGSKQKENSTCTRSCYKNNYFSMIHQCIINNHHIVRRKQCIQWMYTVTSSLYKELFLTYLLLFLSSISE